MIENITDYNYNLLKNFVIFITKRTKITTLIASLVIIICAIIEFIFAEYVMGTIFISVGIFFLITSLNMSKIAVKKLKQMPKLKNKYEFFPENLRVTTYSSEEQLESATISYNMISKIVERENVCYLYLNKTQALIVDNSKFNNLEEKEIVKRYIQMNNPNVILPTTFEELITCLGKIKIKQAAQILLAERKIDFSDTERKYLEEL